MFLKLVKLILGCCVVTYLLNILVNKIQMKNVVFKRKYLKNIIGNKINQKFFIFISMIF